MIAPAKFSTDHEKLHKKVRRIQGEAWEEYRTLPQHMQVRQSTGNVIIRLGRPRPADDMAAVREVFLVALSGTGGSSNVRISEVYRESLGSLRKANGSAEWKRLASIKSDVLREPFQVFTDASEMTSFREDSQTLFDRPDKLNWNDTKNDRRCELIDKEIEGTLLPAEKRELEELQRQMLAYRRKVAPLPLKEAQRLHQQLLKKAAEQVD